MNPWKPDDNPHQARRVGKTIEELGELIAVLARISIQGLDSIDPSSGKTNRARLHEEVADVLAQIHCDVESLDMDVIALDVRKRKKCKQMGEWEDHFKPDTEQPDSTELGVKPSVVTTLVQSVERVLLADKRVNWRGGPSTARAEQYEAYQGLHAALDQAKAAVNIGGTG